MLGLSWQLEGYARYQVPPGGAIAFELWRTPAGPLATRLVYFAQTIEQLHANPPLTSASPPAAEILPIGGCKGDGGTCAFADFTTLAGRAIEPACVTAGGKAP
jgi:4-phytase/acid phosphatase